MEKTKRIISTLVVLVFLTAFCVGGMHHNTENMMREALANLQPAPVGFVASPF